MYHTPNYRNRGSNQWLDRLRMMLGRRVKRQLPEPGNRPHIGDYIAYRDLVMQISEPLDPDLWDWLVFNRWRQVFPKRDRRRYRKLPGDSFRRFARCTAEQRDAAMVHLLDRHRPAETKMMGKPTGTKR